MDKSMKTKTTTETREGIHKRLVDCYRDMVYMSPDAAIKLAEIAIVDQIMQLIQQEKQDLLEIVDKQVIGEDERPICNYDHDNPWCDYCIESKNLNIKLAEQRKKLAEIKEGKGEK